MTLHQNTPLKRAGASSPQLDSRVLLGFFVPGAGHSFPNHSAAPGSSSEADWRKSMTKKIDWFNLITYTIIGVALLMFWSVVFNLIFSLFS